MYEGRKGVCCDGDLGERGMKTGEAMAAKEDIGQNTKGQEQKVLSEGITIILRENIEERISVNI